MIDNDTGEVLLETKKRPLTSGYAGKFQLENFLDVHIKSLLRGIEKDRNLSLQIDCTKFSIPTINSIF